MRGYPARLGIVVFAASIIGMPYLSVAEYSPLRNAVSELGGQGMPHAWVMNIGFAVFGAGTATAALAVWRAHRAESAALIVFGLAMIGVALWSHLPIDPDWPADPGEDRTHSVMASLAGTAFAVACAARLVRHWPERVDRLSLLGLVASVALPAAMLAFPAVEGGLQRVMFAISVVWIWRALPPG